MHHEMYLPIASLDNEFYATTPDQRAKARELVEAMVSMRRRSTVLQALGLIYEDRDAEQAA